MHKHTMMFFHEMHNTFTESRACNCMGSFLHRSVSISVLVVPYQKTTQSKRHFLVNFPSIQALHKSHRYGAQTKRSLRGFHWSLLEHIQIRLSFRVHVSFMCLVQDRIALPMVRLGKCPAHPRVSLYVCLQRAMSSAGGPAERVRQCQTFSSFGC